MDKLIQKYNLPVPRYTSYPTVPFWYAQDNKAKWTDSIAANFDVHNAANGISLYIHLPFCESLCTYCGCNKKITTNHSVEEEYMQAIIKEWNLYNALMNDVPVIRELHLGGGTPTFFSPANLQRLLNEHLKYIIINVFKDRLRLLPFALNCAHPFSFKKQLLIINHLI